MGEALISVFEMTSSIPRVAAMIWIMELRKHVLSMRYRPELVCSFVGKVASSASNSSASDVVFYSKSLLGSARGHESGNLPSDDGKVFAVYRAHRIAKRSRTASKIAAPNLILLPHNENITSMTDPC